MNREAIGPAVIAVVCALAVVLAAATLTSPVDQTGGSGVGTGEGDDIGGGDGESVDFGGENDTPSGLVNLGEQGDFSASPICVEELREPWVVLVGVLGIVGIGYLFRRRYDGLSAIAMTTSLSIPTFIVWLLLTTCPDGRDDSGLPEMLSGRSSGGGQSGSNTIDPTTTVPPFDLPVGVVVVVGLALLVVLAVTLSNRDVFSAGLSPSLPTLGSGNDESDRQASVFRGDTDALGRAAGRAADRIEESEDVENEVYRAWVEMTRHLDVDHPESSTPAEFAAAATEAGMDADDVAELTRLFEAVRYGGREATADRESRAVEALRRIESTYAGDTQ